MTDPALSSLLRFHCPFCATELSVNAAQAGIEGPCPACYQTIKAPEPAAPQVRTALPAPAAPPFVILQSDFTGSAPEKPFKAKLAIPLPEHPPEETRRRRRSRTRPASRLHKAEQTAQILLESRGFRRFRLAALAVSALSVFWLFSFLKNNQWRLPWMKPPAAEPARSAAP